MEQLIKTPADNDLDFYANFFNGACNCYDSFYKPVQDYFKKGAGKDIFKPLDFWNLFWNPFNFIDEGFKKGTPNRCYTIIEELQTLPLNDREKHIIFGMILKFYDLPRPQPHSDTPATITICLLERAFLSYKLDTPEKKFCLRNGFYAQLDYYDKAKSYQYRAKDFVDISANNDFDFYFSHVPKTILVFDTLKYFEIGERKAYIEPLAFLNLLWPQVVKINKTPQKPYQFVEELNALPLQDEELRHVLFSFILKWFGGFPIESEFVFPYDGYSHRKDLKPVLELIEEEFSSFKVNTPEIEQRQKRLKEAKAKQDAEIDKEVNDYSRLSEPVLVHTSTESNKPNAKTIQAQKNYVVYTNKYIDFCKCVRPNYSRERAIQATLKEFGISEKTLGRAFDANKETLIKFGHQENKFKKYPRVKWS